MISAEAKAVDAYASKLNAVGDFVSDKKPWQAPPRSAVNIEESYFPGAPLHGATPSRDNFQRWEPPPRHPAPARPAQGRARKPPTKDWKAAAPKVDSGKAGPAGRKKQAAKEMEPWEAWEGQDRELAGNLANDIMEYSPGIRWDDIAGLHDAKQILKARAHSCCMMMHSLLCTVLGVRFVLNRQSHRLVSAHVCVHPC
jgi:SpoVK/Ycf46/Vps4 family AAA+-type ATPase